MSSVSIEPPRAPDHPIDDLFVRRWSPRAFADDPISEAELLALLEAARWAPSSRNLQPWRFVYALRGDATWSDLLDGLAPGNRGWAKAAAALVAVASATHFAADGAARPNASHAFDAGAAWAHFALQAALAGWYTHPMGGFDAVAVARAIHLPAEHAIHVVVAVGRLGDPATLPDELRARELPKGRRPLAQIAFHGRFPGDDGGR